MATIVYLDVDDEITSAASRIRAADAARVGMMVPFGSRVATSRINFRLLAREANQAGRRLDIIAPDASSRALAASAGLPVFASVAEYEAALAGGEDLDAAAAASAAAVAAATAARATPAGGRPSRSKPFASAPEPGAVAPTGPGPLAPAAVDDAAAAPATAPGSQRRGLGRRPGVGLVAGVLILVLAIGAAGVAAAMFLPAAQITLTPVMEPVPPVSLTVTADPAVAEPDAAHLVIPATTIEIPVTSTADFPATGRKVSETKATGQVRFASINTVFPVSVPAGTRVSTLDGTVFATNASVTVPRATVSGRTIQYGYATVGITAVKAGTAGNVDAGTITQAPDTLRTQQVSVTNPAATTGGTHTETKLVSQQDVNAAVAQLTKDLTARFATEVGNPARVPQGQTAYPETAKLGVPVPAPDPATLVGRQVDTFTLAMSATGTLLAVDPAPANAMGEAALRAAVTPGYQLVDGSIAVQVGEGSVTEDGKIGLPVSGTALQVRPIDAAALESKVLGLSEADAHRILDPFGTAEIALWPGWVSTIPTLEQRVTFTVRTASKPAVTPTVPPTGAPSAPPAPTPAPAASDSPVPSG